MRAKRNMVPIVVVSLCATVVLGVWATGRMTDVLRGNRRIEVYGRVVDEQSRPIEGATVVYQLWFGTRIEPPLPHFSEDKSKLVSTVTDANGDYCLNGVRGNGVNLYAVSLGGRNLESAMGIPASQPMSWTFKDPSSGILIPDTPSRRITYTFKRSPVR